MSDLTDFLLARIAEDEGMASFIATKATRSSDARAAHWSRERVLAECDAKRRIVEVCRPFRSDGSDRLAVSADVLELLALPYADHADYRQEWKP